VAISEDSAMKFHAFHFNWLCEYGEIHFLFGLAGGRIEYDPEAQWLYSFRLFLGVCKIELLWTTGKSQEEAL
jgi:hypothetical protein